MRVMKVLLLTGIIAVSGCRQNTDEQRYINYINDPKYKITQKITVGDVQATIKWLPLKYRQFRKIKSAEDSSMASNDDFYFFDVRFDKSKGEKPSREKLLYLNFDMQDDFVLLAGADSVAPAICQKIENGVSGSYQYLLAFEKLRQTQEEDFSVFYKDKIFGIGTMAFVYLQKDIKRIPALKEKKGNEILSKTP